MSLTSSNDSSCTAPPMKTKTTKDTPLHPESREATRAPGSDNLPAGLAVLAAGPSRAALPESTSQGHGHVVCGSDTLQKPESLPLSPYTFPATVSFMGSRWWQFRKRRDERCAQETSQFYDNARRNRHSLVTVLTPTQFARRGSKAVISVDGGPPCDAWFWWFRVAPGQVVAVDQIGQGWGPHSQRHGVIYIGSEAACGAHAWLPADVRARAQRFAVGGRRSREPAWVAPSRR